MHDITDVIVLENYIKKESSENVIKAINTMKEKGKISFEPVGNRYSLNIYKDSPGVRNYQVELLIRKILKKIQVEKFFEWGYVVSDYVVLIYEEGSFMLPHIDDSVPEYGKCLYTLIAYLNDDYEGGEIYYPELDLKIKPKALDVIVHPGTIKHEVKPVTNGKRYVVAFGLTNEKDKNVLEGGIIAL
jgi:predicted 2-oxoglutarate/Fe(II)-dependent dioxygenase YbiX